MKNLILRIYYSIKITGMICLLGSFNGIIAQTPGRGNISKFNSNWELSTVMEDNNWFNKWDQIIAIDIDNDGADELLCYAKMSKIAEGGRGLADIYDISSSGELRLIKRHKNWLKVWDKLLALDIDGDGKSELLMYSKNSNLAESGKALADIYDISSTGTLKLIKRHKNWFIGWDELKALNIDSNNDRELLCYAKNTNISEPGRALADFYKISRTGDVKLVKRHKNWFKGWNQFTIIDVNNDNKNELLCYAKNSGIAPNGKGLGDIYTVSSLGDVKLIKRHTNWLNGWSQIVFDNFGGSNKGYGGPSNGELFFYGKGDKYGISQTANISANGVLSTLKINNKMNPQLAIALSVKKERGNVSNILLYAKKNGSSNNKKAFGFNAGNGWTRSKPNDMIGTKNAAYVVLNFTDGREKLNNNLNSNSTAKAARYFKEVSGGKFTLNNLPVMGAYETNKGCTEGFANPYEITFRNFAIETAVKKGLKISNYDKLNMKGKVGRDGKVTPQELGFTVISNCSAPPDGTFAVARQSNVNVDGINYSGYVATGGANTNLKTIIHEQMHVYGNVFDLYGDRGSRICNCWDASLMEATITPNFNEKLIHPDPFHKLVFGWLEPRIFDLNKYPPSLLKLALTRGGKKMASDKAPVILYDSRIGFGEFYILEYRSPKGSDFDAALTDEGVAVWHIKKNPSGIFIENGIKLIRAKNTSFWDNSDGDMKLKWSNGRYLPISIAVTQTGSANNSAEIKLTPQ